MSDFWNFSRVASQYGQVADIYQEAENVQYKRDSILASDWHEVNLQKSLNGLKSQLSGMAPEKQKEFFDNGGLDKWKQSVQKLSLNSPFRDTLEVRTEGYLLEQAPLLEKMRQGAVDGDFLTKFSQIGQDYLDKGDIAGYDAKLSEYAKAGIGSEALKQAYGLKTSWAENRLNQGALSGRGWQYILGDVGPPPVAPTPPKDLSIAPEYVQKAALADYQNQMNAYNAKLTEYKKDVEAVNMIDPVKKQELAGKARTTLEAMEKDGRDAREDQVKLVGDAIQSAIDNKNRERALYILEDAKTKGVFLLSPDDHHKFKNWIDEANKQVASGGGGGGSGGQAGDDFLAELGRKLTKPRSQYSDSEAMDFVNSNRSKLTDNQVEKAKERINNRTSNLVTDNQKKVASNILKASIATMMNKKPDDVPTEEIDKATEFYTELMGKARQTNPKMTADQEGQIIDQAFNAYKRQKEILSNNPVPIGENLGIRELSSSKEYQYYLANKDVLVSGYNSGNKDYKDAYSRIEEAVKRSLANNFAKGDFRNQFYRNYVTPGEPLSMGSGPYQGKLMGDEAFGKPIVLVPMTPKKGIDFKKMKVTGLEENPVFDQDGTKMTLKGYGMYMMPPTKPGERTKVWDSKTKTWFDAEDIPEFTGNEYR